MGQTHTILGRVGKRTQLRAETMIRVLAIIPAHNEEKNIPGIVRGIQSQTIHTDLCIVSDNSTDRTAELARELGATIVTETVGNTGMRSGAINWAMDRLAQGYDFVLAMDADSVPALNMIEEGIKALEADSKLGMVCSRAGVLPQPELKSLIAKFLWYVQSIEYGCYDSSRVETTGQIKVAHGLSTLFRREFLEDQRKAMDRIYNVDALAEDLDLTMDAKLRGWKVSSCQKMKAWTIVPTRIGWLFKQRTRWSLGGIDSIIGHGFNWITWWEIYNHISGVVLLAIQLFVVSLVFYLIAHGQSVSLSPLFYVVIGAAWFDGLYRFRYCQHKDIWSILIVLSLIPQTLFCYLQIAATWNAYYQFVTRAKRSY